VQGTGLAGISVVDRKLLWGRSGNECAFPECGQALTMIPAEVGAESASPVPVVVGDEAHIVAEEDKGPRGDPSMPVSDRNAYLNRILLCPKHHRLIDKDRGIHFSVTQLQRMKADHEAQVERRRLGASNVQDDPMLHSPPVALPGRLLGEISNPFDLEVHGAIDAGASAAGLPVLPAYVARAHDRLIEEAVRRAAGGASVLVMLVGDSSTGKTRACWEALGKLPADWRLWHPVTPDPRHAVLGELSSIGPRTVVWLNDAQNYLLTDHGNEDGERVAAGLWELLRDRRRGPVLILGTIWPEDYATLTRNRQPGEPDPHPRSRILLTGSGHGTPTTIVVPSTFTDQDMASLRDKASQDPRLAEAATNAEQGQITQYLAAGPALLDRYRTAPVAARALIQVAMDARRLGHPLPLPGMLLETAVAGYLTDIQWEQLSERKDWLKQALDYTKAPVRGTRGPLTPIRRGAGYHPDNVTYRLADYLEQIGRAERIEVFPPASFWDAIVAASTSPRVLREFGGQAERRGRFGRARQLYQRAADAGDATASREIARLSRRAADPVLSILLRETGRALEDVGDLAGAEEHYRLAAVGKDAALLDLARLREQSGDLSGAIELCRQAAANLDPAASRNLARLLEQSGDLSQAAEWYESAVHLGDEEALQGLIRLREQTLNPAAPGTLTELAGLRALAGDMGLAENLYRQAASRDDPGALRGLARLREQTGDLTGAENLYRQAADHEDPDALRQLARLRREADDLPGAEAFAAKAAQLSAPGALLDLARLREEMGDFGGAEALCRQAADHGITVAMSDLPRLRERAGDRIGAEKLAMQMADEGDAAGLRELAEFREKVGDRAGAEAIATRTADYSVLLGLARMRKDSGDLAGAEALYQRAADLGECFNALRFLGVLREEAGDFAGAETLFRQAIGRGDPAALSCLAGLRIKSDNWAEVEQIERFGLSDDGSPATS